MIEIGGVMEPPVVTEHKRLSLVHLNARRCGRICGVPFYNGYCKEKWQVEVW